MTRLYCFLALAAVLFSSAPVASAQGGASFVQEDYERYAKLFTAGRELVVADFATAVEWRSRYGNNKWKDYANGTEFRDPMPEAQVLTGLYLLSSVERKVISDIENIALEKGLLSPKLAESAMLSKMAAHLEKNLKMGDVRFYSDGELENRMGYRRNFYGTLIRDGLGINSPVGAVASDIKERQRLASSIPDGVRKEVTALRNRFSPDAREGWLAKYRVLRENIEALDELANSFAFNWDEENMKKELDKLMTNNEGVQREAERRARKEIAKPPQKTMAEEIEIRERLLRDVAKEELDVIVEKHKAFKYMIGVYVGLDYHRGDLRKIYYYFLDAANKGNPLAQYHLALFLLYFGEIVDVKKEDAERDFQRLLQTEMKSEATKKRVEELNIQLIAEDQKKEQRVTEAAGKIEILLRLVHDRMDTAEKMLIESAKRTKIVNEIQRSLIDEMERDRERRAEIYMEWIRSRAMVEAARLESTRPVIFTRPW